MPGLLDHGIAVLLLVLAPLYSSRTYRRFLAKASDAGHDRISEYRGTMLRQWIACGLVLFLWLLLRRPVSQIGLTVEGGWRGAVGAGVATFVLAFLAFQWRLFRRLDGAKLDPVRTQLEPVRAILPVTESEYRTFRKLAITAGVCEEVLYRGFLIWYLASFVGTWPAVAIGALGFGLAHFYQGPSGILKTGIAGAVTGSLYVLSGSLLWPMIVHAAIDLQGGAIGYRVLSLSPTDSEALTTDHRPLTPDP